MAIAGATGISSGSAHNIGQLLIEEVGGASFSGLEKLSPERDEIVEGVRCKSIHGNVPGADAEVTIFIDPETLINPAD